MNITVAIRVRPFNKREKEIKSKLCIEMINNKINIYNEKKVNKTFGFDYCFWSHDGFQNQLDGYSASILNSNYADQLFVYEKIGKNLLTNIIEGYNSTLFAYGQTGSGKSYSIFGYGNNKGILPMICEDLFKGDFLTKNLNNQFILSVSMIEIYNEKIQDLLISINNRTKEGLKVRENNKIGIFIENVTSINVNSYEDILKIIFKGEKNRTLGATLMNETSSRSHTIFSIDLLQKTNNNNKTTTKQAKLNIVDLAGSERITKTHAEGQRLKESQSINKSLTVLGMVIHQLYEKECGKHVNISYRDSVLTRILQDALGGNSKTTMLCAVSPALDNIDETLSTLRYEKKKKNKTKCYY